MASNTKTIHIELFDEGTKTARPTQGIFLGNGLYRVLPTPNYDPHDEHWGFLPGSVVRCVTEEWASGEILIARELVEIDKTVLQELFVRIVSDAIQKAEEVFNEAIPHNYIIELHGAGVAGKSMLLNEAIEYMYTDSTSVYPFIDVGVKCVKGGLTVMFVRISGHSPETFSQAWNTSEGSGPFKVIIPVTLTKVDT